MQSDGPRGFVVFALPSGKPCFTSEIEVAWAAGQFGGIQNSFQYA